MAIYHYSAGFVSRSTGRSAVQSAAYITGSKLEESRRDLSSDYRNRSADITYVETFAPKHAPDHMKTLAVWNSLENYEDRYAALRYRTEETRDKYKNCAQIAQTTVVALPKELNPDVWKELVSEFAKEQFVERGLVVTAAIHNDEGNPHAHFQISRRKVTENGEWSWAKDREITTKSALIESRRLWAEKTNSYLAREGIEERINHRSYADLGLPFEPTKHEGWYSQKLEKVGRCSRIVEENKEIKNRNKETLAFQPENILKELTSKQATFSSLDLARLVQKRLQDDPKLASYVFESSLEQAILVGVSLDGQARYTRNEYLKIENQALEQSHAMMNEKTSLVINPDTQDALLKSKYHYLNNEQVQAVKSLCEDQQLGVMIGRAGTGKTTTLKAVVDLHKQAGYNIYGLSLSAAAAENLGLEANCYAETVAFFLDKWNRKEEVYQKFWSMHPSSEHPIIEKQLKNLEAYSLTDKHLVIVDEAGMIGTSQWAQLLQFTQKANAKLIAVGDDHQFKAIEAGDFFRRLKEKAHEQDYLSELNNIIRQKDDWMKKASEDLAELKTYQALASYEQKGHIQKIDDLDLQPIARAYVDRCINDPEQKGLLLAFTRLQCQGLNDEARKILKERELISENDVNINGRFFSIGDQVVFLKNDREKQITCLNSETKKKIEFLVKNGTRGKILEIKEIQLDISTPSTPQGGQNITSYEITTLTDNGTKARFSTSEYNHIDHSYAITLHKAQGQTVDWSMIVASKNMDAHATYVALTRHRKDVTLFYDTKTFSDFSDLQKSLSRVSNKDLVVDYTIRPEHHNAWENVQEYILLGRDLTTTARESDWSTYQAFKMERDILGQNILSEWKEHSSYTRQAGLSKESIEIACGLKMRPLSLIEKQAQYQVQEYSKKAMEARLLWRTIRTTHPGTNCYEHSKYSDFNCLRLERNNLAKEIVNNQHLYKNHISKLSQELGIGWKTLKNQALTNTITTSIIKEVLNKYKLEKPGHLTNETFENNVQKMLDRLPQWNKAMGVKHLKNEEKVETEKTIIAEAIKHEAKKRYCFLSTPLEASIRSEGIALVAASLIQAKDRPLNLSKALEVSAKIYDEQLKQTEPLKMGDQNIYKKTPMEKLSIVIEQHSPSYKTSLNTSKLKDNHLEL